MAPSNPKAAGGTKRKEAPSKSQQKSGGNGQQSGGSRSAKRVKIHDARNLRTQRSDAALEDGKLNLEKFLNTREFEIKALESSMKKCKSANATRVFQQVPRAMRRRTASHNVKRVPKRLRDRARKEMMEDNTPTVESRKRRPRTTRARIRAETRKKLRFLAAKKQKKKLVTAGEKSAGDDSTTKTPVETRAPRPKIRRDTPNEPPKAQSKFRKRQMNKTWLPTHLWHAKRATMTEPTEPLWRFAIPLTPTAKCYRPTHRASGQQGVVVWDMSYMSTVALYGSAEGMERALRALGLSQDGLWGARGQKWRAGLRKWTGILSRQTKDSRRDIGPATIVWNPEPPAGEDSMEAAGNAPKKPQRQLFLRCHPSCFQELFNEMVRLAKLQKPQLHVEDLRFEIGSIELTGPGSTEALLGVLRPFYDSPEMTECHGSVFKRLAGVTNPATLPKDAILAFSANDPRLAYPPKRISIPGGSNQALMDTLTQWPVDETLKPFDIFSRHRRHQASLLASQKSINRRRGVNTPGESLPVSTVDPPIPVLLLASRSAADGQAQGTWTMLAPWKCIQAIWYSLMHYPLNTGGNPRLGGLDEQRQIAFEHGTPWFPGDFLATDAGLNWELEQRAKRKRDWDRRPKGKRVEWKSLDLGAGRKGEIGDGLACDFEHLFGVSKINGPQAPAPSSISGATEAMELDPPEQAENAGTQGLSHQTPTGLSAVRQISKASFNSLASSPAAGNPPANSIVTVNVSFVSRGVAATCARIYRLPSRVPKVSLQSTQTEVPASMPPPCTPGSLPADLRDQWLSKLPLKSTTTSNLNKRKAPQGAPRMPPGTDLETRKNLLAKSLPHTELPYPRPAANQVDVGGHPLCPDEEDLIGFVTTGSFSLSEGKGSAIGSISAEKALAALRETGLREGKLCIRKGGGLRRSSCLCSVWCVCFPPAQRHLFPTGTYHVLSPPTTTPPHHHTDWFPICPRTNHNQNHAASATGPPELSDTDYLREVLGRPCDRTEFDLELEVIAKATALGIELPLEGGRLIASEEPNTSSADESSDDITLPVQHGRTTSTSSNDTANSGSTSQTSRHSIVLPATLTESAVRRRSRTFLTFSQYDKYLGQIDSILDQPKFLRSGPAKPEKERSVGLLVRAGTIRGVQGLKRSITKRLRMHRSTSSSAAPIPCICCCEDFTRDKNILQTLPCGHNYCPDCLEVMISQSIIDESMMPPRCCTQPIPSSIIKNILPRDKQQLFLKAVVQYSTPWEVRLFCPNTACGEFIPPVSKMDPKHPFEAICKYCRTRVCIMCKRNAHRLGQDCPEDTELDAVLKIGESSGWRRCYKCRTLVELAQGCTHMTCRCKAQFCYICGAVWEPCVGCPNFCNGEEELERRRIAEEARQAELEAEELAREKAAQAEELARQEAEKRAMESTEFKQLRRDQEAEMLRFREFEKKAKGAMRARQLNKKLALVERYTELTEKMRDRHAKTEQHLEDRQVMVEFELHASLEEKEKKIRLKLRHMEEYCNGNGKIVLDRDSKMPIRQITLKDREQLRQQYFIRDGMQRRHEAEINVLREKQAKAMEELKERHVKETEALADRRAEEIEDLAVEFTNEEELLVNTFRERKTRLISRWEIAIETLRVQMEKQHNGLRYAGIALPKWPDETSAAEYITLAFMSEDAR
ncbi:ribonucleases P/MRP protein subunit POP1 [Podospora australis]|uniref:Ribonucleases P/MRP protein subunit POP1 n=1 Tax=Podospora australis TaxID=1536484 RepID=A0AAN7AHC1_9PEZI|nr:ribonucleases P/MRP protein subunit POP1 [Podospora australis]